MSAFGSVALRETLLGNTAIAEAVNSDLSTSLFVFFQDFPFSSVINVIAVVLIAGFFITSSDSGSLVVDSLTSGGKIEAPVGQRIFWALAEGTVAAVLLVGGGLQALQTATIVTGLPFAVLLLVVCYSLYKGLKEDLGKLKRKENQKEKENYEDMVQQIVLKRKNKANQENQ